MVNKQCCRSCGHCLSSETGTSFLCRLRNLQVHPDIATLVFCHHWTKKSASLPKLDEKHLPRDKQLDFDRVLSSKYV